MPRGFRIYQLPPDELEEEPPLDPSSDGRGSSLEDELLSPLPLLEEELPSEVTRTGLEPPTCRRPVLTTT